MLLDELESLFDITLIACEEETPLALGVVDDLISVWNSVSNNPLEFVVFVLGARVCFADMCSEWTEAIGEGEIICRFAVSRYGITGDDGILLIWRFAYGRTCQELSANVSAVGNEIVEKLEDVPFFHRPINLAPHCSALS